MMVGKEELGLSLSLNFPTSNNRSSIFSPQFVSQNKPISWNSIFPSSDRTSETFRPETKSFLRGIDVNKLAECEEETPGVSSPNSTISSLSGKRTERETMTIDENESSRGISDDDDGDNSRKKLRLSKDQAEVLEESFKEHNTLNPKQKLALAKRLGLRPRQVEVWFQNRRARTKLKQTEVDCEFLKRCCDNLAEENQRLQKEVQELRALKHSPQFYMQMAPPTTLTMCPSCERVAVPPSSASNATPTHDHYPMNVGPSRQHFRPMPVNPWATNSSVISLRQPRA